MKKNPFVFLSLIIALIASYLGIILSQYINFGIPVCYVLLFPISLIISLISSIVFTSILDKKTN